MSQLDELRQLAIEADQRGDRATAMAVMDKIESLMAQPAQPEIVPRGTSEEIGLTDLLSFSPLGAVLDMGKQRETMQAITEPIAAVTTGAVAEPIAGLSGLSMSAISGVEAGTETVNAVRDALTRSPKTPAGQQALKTMGELIQKGIDIARFPLSGLAGLVELATGQGIDKAVETIKAVQEQGLGETAGRRTLEETGSPGAAAAVETAIKGAPAALPIGKMFKTRSAFKQKIAQQIEAGGTDKTLAKYMVSGSGKVQTDPLAKSAIKQGFDEGVISAVKGASKVDRAKMGQMVNVLKKGKENALYAMKNRPTDVAGDSLMGRVRYLKNVNRNAGSKLDKVAAQLKGKSIDSSAPIDNFLQNLDDMGVRIDRNLKPVFAGSDVEGLSGPMSAISKVVKRLKSGKPGQMPDAYELHRMKRFIDENVTYGKQGEGLKGKTERVLKQLRRDIDDTLDNKFDAYNKVNTTYSDTVNALDSLQDVAGKKMDLFGPNADKAVGTLLRRMMSNAQSRVNLVDAVDQLEGMAKKYGGKFSDDISSQMLFADELDNVFGPVARTSLAGETAKGIRKGAEVVTGRRGVGETALEMGAAGIKKMAGINEEAAFKSISDLLKRQ